MNGLQNCGFAIPSSSVILTSSNHSSQGLWGLLSSKKPLNLDAIRDIRETAEEYGKIMSMTAKSGHAYIEFQEASDCQEAYSAVCGKTFDEKIVFALFYPISLWNQKIYI